MALVGHPSERPELAGCCFGKRFKTDEVCEVQGRQRAVRGGSRGPIYLPNYLAFEDEQPFNYKN